MSTIKQEAERCLRCKKPMCSLHCPVETPIPEVNELFLNGEIKKAGELLSVAKLNIRIMELKGQVNTALREVGELLYATHTGNPTESDELLAKMEEIDALRAEIAAMEEELGREIVPICGTCGAEVQENDVYCRACGDKL